RRWSGRYDPDSIGATVAHDLRVNATLSPFSNHDTITSTLEAVRRSRPRGGGEILDRVFDCPTAAAGPCVRNIPWGEAGAITIRHPLHGLGISWLDGPTLRGDGDKYTLHVQRESFTQSFRAVWDVGNWDAGGIVIPCGESGEPGSAHYQDLAADWQAQRLVPLWYSRKAAQQHMRATQTLEP
ncbi:MAG: penicillin acylase family protein, partial [Candidatus Eremiobacteraeota bacterium]|nr:penicillin acylase family protein [Candidatus Eremiobacteraeota bacterium]